MNPESRLLHLPQSSRYAISAMLCLASLPTGEYHMVGGIAKRTKLSPSYLSKILQRLAQSGILDSRRGAKGGYRLSRPAGEVSLARIVAASHRMGTGAMPCMIEAKDCDCANPCSMHEFVAGAEEIMWQRLNKTTLDNFAASSNKPGDNK
jgi:Rrf2 family iron-sulfur cluster assembly transcriptional regulator